MDLSTCSPSMNEAPDQGDSSTSTAHLLGSRVGAETRRRVCGPVSRISRSHRQRSAGAGVKDQPELRQASGDAGVTSITRSTTCIGAPRGSRTRPPQVFPSSAAVAIGPEAFELTGPADSTVRFPSLFYQARSRHMIGPGLFTTQPDSCCSSVTGNGSDGWLLAQDAAKERRPVMVVPLPGPESTCSSPPRALKRSAMPCSPVP